MTHRLSVVIPTYNDVDLLPHTLAPLLADPATGELVVVVDGSDDGSLELLRQMAHRDARLRPFFIENRGRAGARQFALEQATLDTVLLLDADVVAERGLVSGHARWHENSLDRLVVGYMPTWPVCAPSPESFVIAAYSKQYEATCAEYERDPEFILRRLWGGNVSVSRRALLRVGGCDGGVGIRYTDDVELGLRLERIGLEPVFDRRLRAEHRLTRSISGFRSTARLLGADLVLLDALYPGSVEFPSWRASGLGGALRQLARRPRGHRALTALSARGVAALGAAGLWSAQARAAAILERFEIQRGMQDQHRRLATGQAGSSA